MTTERIGGPNGERCGACGFYDPDLNPESGPDVGVCHRYPKAIPSTEPVNGWIGEKQLHLWPEMRATDWCGEFREIEDKSNGHSEVPKDL